MYSDTNIGARIIAVIICIVIGIGSFQIADETYTEIDSKNYELERMIQDNRNKLNSQLDYKIDFWYKMYGRQQSNRFAILYSSLFVFCVSLCCFTYLCAKQ